ncbi:hypothetical protein HK405_006917, partial [Cladochytrium tenue]
MRPSDAAAGAGLASAAAAPSALQAQPLASGGPAPAAAALSMVEQLEATLAAGAANTTAASVSPTVVGSTGDPQRLAAIVAMLRAELQAQAVAPAAAAAAAATTAPASSASATRAVSPPKPPPLSTHSPSQSNPVSPTMSGMGCIPNAATFVTDVFRTTPYQLSWRSCPSVNPVMSIDGMIRDLQQAAAARTAATYTSVTPRNIGPPPRIPLPELPTGATAALQRKKSLPNFVDAPLPATSIPHAGYGAAHGLAHSQT